MASNKKKEKEKQQEIKKTPAAVKEKTWLYSLVFAVIAFLIYANTLNHGYVLDDFSVIRENNVIMQGTKAIPTIFKTSYRYGYMNLEDGLYRPLSLAMFATEWEISPDNPSLNHWVNVLLFAFSCSVLFIVLRKLFHQYSLAIPAIATLLFAVHPLHTEVVANIKSRDEILSLLFILFSFYALLKATKNQMLLYILSGFLFFVSLLSKESGITMLAGFPLLLWAFTERKIKNIVIGMLPHLVFTAIFLTIRFQVLEGKLSDTTVSVLDNFILGSADVTVQFATAVKVLGLYLKLFLVPQPLLYDYSFNKIPLSSLGDPLFIISFVIHLALFVYAVIKIRSKNVYAVFILLYFISISLFSNVFLKIGVGMAERLMYFPSLSVCVLAAFGLCSVFKEKISESKSAELFQSHKLSIVTTLVISFLFSLKTIARNADWKDNFTLYSNDLKDLQESTRAHYYLGNEIIKYTAPQEKNAARQRELFQQGINELQLALRIYPAYSEALSQLAVGYYKTADYSNAVKYSKLALEHNPNDIITINNLGSALFQTGKQEEAMTYYQKSVQLNPRYEDGWMNIGSINGMLQHYNEAIEAFNKALTINPNNARAYYYIGITYRSLGNEKSAVEYINKAKRLDPSLQ